MWQQGKHRPTASDSRGLDHLSKLLTMRDVEGLVLIGTDNDGLRATGTRWATVPGLTWTRISNYLRMLKDSFNRN